MGLYVVVIYGDYEGDMDIIKEYEEPKGGHWIDHQIVRWIYAKCSECGTVYDPKTNYCPNCGAKMDEPQEAR